MGVTVYQCQALGLVLHCRIVNVFQIEKYAVSVITGDREESNVIIGIFSSIKYRTEILEW